MTDQGEGDVRVELRRTYGELAGGGPVAATCCSPAGREGSGPPAGVPGGEPEAAMGPGLGCGDPVPLARLEPGQSVLDLGSGVGLDCIRAGRQVGPDGKVIGVDMTPGMIARARENVERIGANNVEFRLGEIEHLPVSDGSVDIVISNCVLNLSPDRDRAFREAWRVLKPGGTLAVCDVLLDAPIPASVLERLPDGGACVQGAVHEAAYVAAIERAGFVDVCVDREYPRPVLQSGEVGGGARMVVQIGETGEEVGSVDLGAGVDPDSLPRSFNGRITARKPDDAGVEPPGGQVRK